MSKAPPMSFTAVVLAADRNPDDPVARAAGVACKALSPIAGRAMILRVLETLAVAQTVESRVLVGPSWSIVAREKTLYESIDSGRLRWLENANSPSQSAYNAMQSLDPQIPVLVTTADHALLKPEMVDYFCTRARDSGCDVVAALASFDLIEKRFPGMRRTVTKLRDGGYCGCNLFAFLTPRARKAAEFWRQIEHDRKKPLRIIGLLGWTTVLRFLLGRLTLDEGLERLSRRLDLRVGAVILPFPEAAVDVDTVEDWRFAQSLVEKGAA